ncbi:lamin tail domain-containing protein [candidate division KSB1 bacterium]|nr:lamin tail domain-containing protein [candidate division KSB1 bacterium]
MKIFNIILIISGSLLYPVSLSAKIILSEIMFNPLGNERYNEFIELYNTSASDSVNLDHWLLSDGEKYNNILPSSGSTVLQPLQYAVVLVPNYYENSSEYENTIPESALKLTINSSLFGSYGLANDREETVSIYTPDSTIVASWTYNVPNPEGISEEKRIPGQGDDESNWGHSLVEGGTPGYKNSITPEEYDIAINNESFRMEPENPGYGDTGFISINVKNAGMTVLYDVSVVCAYQTAGAEFFCLIGDTIKIPCIDAFKSEQVKITWPDIPSGVFILKLAAFHPLDRNPDNNLCLYEIITGYPERALIINEIMYNPLPDMPEWVELYNPGTFTVNLKNWKISDKDTANAVILCDTSVFINPYEFIIITRDSAIYSQLDPGAMVFINKNLPSLNNDMDGVTIFDGVHTIIEQLLYEQGWGGAKGKSLERINPGIAGNRKNNWGTSVGASGHTAGFQNSIFTTVLPAKTSLTISPDPFSPDGDGHDDLTAIQYTLDTHTAYLNIRIFDIQGRQVRFLINNEPGGSKGTIFWDGLDDEGLTCRMGIYIILLEAENHERQKIDRVQDTVVLAKNL